MTQTQGIFSIIFTSIYFLLLGYSLVLMVRFRIQNYRKKMTRNEYIKELKKGLFVAFLLSLTISVSLMTAMWPQLLPYADMQNEEHIFLFFAGLLLIFGSPLILHGLGVVIGYSYYPGEFLGN